MTLTTALRDALEVGHPHESQDKVHEILANRLHTLAPNATIRTTGYFNHSWAPDFVLASSDTRDRPLFIRFGVNEPSFADDLRYLGADSPVFVDLDAAITHEAQSADDDFALASALQQHGESQVLVTEIQALDVMDSSVRADSGVKTATGQIMIGGQGVVDEPAAERIVTSWQNAVDAVDDASVVQLQAAMAHIEAFLSRIATLDLETELRSRWISAGQPAETFPGKEDWELADRAPWEIAELVASLLAHSAPVHANQWRAISESISASVLGHELYGLNAHHAGGEVNRLAHEGLRAWTARSAYVPLLESDSMEGFDWSVGDYSLAINLISRRAYFTDMPGKWNRVKRSEVLPDASSRLPMLENAGVSGVGLITPEENVSHELRPTASMPLGDRLKQFLGDEGDPAWRAARLTTLDLTVPGTSASAHIDFRRNVVRASEPVPLRTFVLLCAKYVAGLTDVELQVLDESMERRDS